MSNLNELHEQITRQINVEREKEMADFVAAKRAVNEAATRKADRAMDALKATTGEVERFTAFHERLANDNAQEIERIKKKYADDPMATKRFPSEHFREQGLAAAIAPEGTRLLPPSYAAVFSTKDDQDKQSGGTGTEVYNYTYIDAWCWARGAGNGWFGSGAGSYQVWAEWGYWFYPSVYKYYGIIPHNVFRGFYIVRSDDGFWTSKYSRAVVSIWTNVWQYNWKGWSNINALDVGGDNIDVNDRFDTDRHTYYSALLGAGDWAYIRNVVGLYVYARGDGSYSELNFAVGAANYLSAPHVHIY